MASVWASEQAGPAPGPRARSAARSVSDPPRICARKYPGSCAVRDGTDSKSGHSSVPIWSYAIASFLNTVKQRRLNLDHVVDRNHIGGFLQSTHFSPGTKQPFVDSDSRTAITRNDGSRHYDRSPPGIKVFWITPRAETRTYNLRSRSSSTTIRALQTQKWVSIFLWLAAFPIHRFCSPMSDK